MSRNFKALNLKLKTFKEVVDKLLRSYQSCILTVSIKTLSLVLI